MRSETVTFELPGVRVGTAEHPHAATGVTVIAFDAGAMCAADSRGGAVSARELSAVSSLNQWGEIDALVFAGGSSLGLEAASGVARAVLTARDGDVDPEAIPAVVSAVVYDFEGRNTGHFPDAHLGSEAFRRATSGEVAIGRVGAGRNVHVGTYFGAEHGATSGQGAAFADLAGARVLAISVVNALGNVRDRGGALVAGCGEDIGERLLQDLTKREGPSPRGNKNTTLTAVITDVALERTALQRLAVMVTAAIARLIDPMHTPDDGDVVFALSTGSRKLPRALDETDFGVLAGRVAQDAVLNAVRSTS